jgi:hypothetical protein
MKFEDIKLDLRVYIKKPTRSNYEPPSSRRLRWEMAYERLSKDNQIFTVKTISKEIDWKTSEDYCEISLYETNLVCDASWLQPVDQTKKSSKIVSWLSRALEAIDPIHSSRERYEKYDRDGKQYDDAPSTKVGFTLKRSPTAKEKDWGNLLRRWWY